VRVAHEVERAGELALGDRERAEGHVKLVGDLLGDDEPSARSEAARAPGGGQGGGALAGRAMVSQLRWLSAHRLEYRRRPKALRRTARADSSSITAFENNRFAGLFYIMHYRV
jgi:hypothetical protein